MALSLSTIGVGATLKATQNNTIDGAGQTASVQLGAAISDAITSGTSANTANRFWQDENRALASGASENIDVYDLAAIDIGGGAGRDALGQLQTLAEIVAIMIKVEDASAGSLIIGGEGSTAAWNSLFNASDTSVLGPIKPGGFVLIHSPGDPAFAVADTSNHLLKLAASGGDVTYSIYLMGRDA